MGFFSKSNKKKKESKKTSNETLEKIPLSTEELLKRKGIELGEHKEYVLALLDLLEILESWHMVAFGLLEQAQCIKITKNGGKKNDLITLPFFSFYLDSDSFSHNSDGSLDVKVKKYINQVKHFGKAEEIVANFPAGLSEKDRKKYRALLKIFTETYVAREDEDDFSSFFILDPLCAEKFLKNLYFIVAFPELFSKPAVDYSIETLDLVFSLADNIQYICVER